MTYRAESLPEPDDRALADTIWVCPYCMEPTGHEPSRPCCGEIGHEILVYEDTWEPVNP